jgi:hypothetical protein
MFSSGKSALHNFRRQLFTNRAKFKYAASIQETHKRFAWVERRSKKDGNKLVFERFACKLLFSLFP